MIKHCVSNKRDADVWVDDIPELKDPNVYTKEHSRGERLDIYTLYFNQQMSSNFGFMQAIARLRGKIIGGRGVNAQVIGEYLDRQPPQPFTLGTVTDTPAARSLADQVAEAIALQSKSIEGLPVYVSEHVEADPVELPKHNWSANPDVEAQMVATYGTFDDFIKNGGK